jgi:hypothetical protein
MKEKIIKVRGNESVNGKTKESKETNKETKKQTN